MDNSISCIIINTFNDFIHCLIILTDSNISFILIKYLERQSPFTPVTTLNLMFE